MLIVPGRAASDGLTWWILAEDSTPLTLELAPSIGAGDTKVHVLADLPGDAGRAWLAATTGLQPDSAYTLSGRTEDGDEQIGRARTLPATLAGGAPFTMALGSCYNWPMDVDEVWRWFPPRQHRPDSADPLRLAFLLGDQIYMDLVKEIAPERPDAWSMPMREAPDPWAAYLEQWRDRRFANLLRQLPPTVFLADDHEMWNDYPHKPLWLPWTRDSGVQKLDRELRKAFDAFQGALNLDPGLVAAVGQITPGILRENADTIRFDVPPLSFFSLDTRLGRTRADTPGAVQFTDPHHLDAVCDWLMEPGGLGILAVGPPIFQGPGSFTDHNLADYTADYARLVTALTNARKRVLVLAGDLHYTRLYVIEGFDPVDARDELRLAELTCSAFSRLKEAPGTDPPGGPEVTRGVLGGSGAHFRLESTDASLGGGDFVTTDRQNYATVTFTHREAEGMIRAVISAWGRPEAGVAGARLLLRRTLHFPVEAP